MVSDNINNKFTYNQKTGTLIKRIKGYNNTKVFKSNLEKYKEWLRYSHSAPSILSYIFLSTLMIAYGLKHSILKYFEHKASRIGIGLMIIGGIIQIIPIWI